MSVKVVLSRGECLGFMRSTHPLRVTFLSCKMTLSVNCTVPIHTSDAQKVYIILAVGIATMSFLLNSMQFVILLQQRLLRDNKNLIILNLCICGQLSSFDVVWYVYKLIADSEGRDVAGNYVLCFLLPSGLHLVTLYAYTPLVTLFLVQHHLVARQKIFQCLQTRRSVVAALISAAWGEALLVALVPAAANNWQDYCSIPSVWSHTFGVVAGLIYLFHYPIILIVFIDTCIVSSKRRRAICPIEESPSPAESTIEDCDHPRRLHLGVRGVSDLVLLFLLGTLPSVGYATYVMVMPSRDPCLALSSDQQVAMWNAWLLVLFSAARPLLQIFSEEDVGVGTADCLTECCCPPWCRRRAEVYGEISSPGRTSSSAQSTQ